MRLSTLIITAMATGCFAKTGADTSWRNTQPEPLAPRVFQLPEATSGTLSNGVEVSVVENHEMPLVNVRIAFDQGGWTDDPKAVGLASVTLDMLNEGAGKLDAAGISKATKAIAANVGCGAGDDSASVSLDVLTKNVEPGLDLLAMVLLQPTFEQDDWDIMKMDRIASLASARNNPRSIASRVASRLQYGNGYQGMLRTEEAYEGITTKEMRAWWRANLTPGNARIYVGGDTTLETIMPLLEARLGEWSGEASGQDKPSATEPNVRETTIFLVDKPGAPQSVLKAFRRLDIERGDADWFNMYMANMMYGGMFSARLNLNLREDKGWTYGARSGTGSNYTKGMWTASTSVKTDTTADSISEILREINDAQSTRPFTADELVASSGYLLGSRPVRYENAGTLMGELQGNWLYGLPEDWITAYADNIRGVTLEGAQAAWNKHVISDELSILVVGDKATILEGLEALKLPIVNLDSDGNTMESE
jgi:zinc protease